MTPFQEAEDDENIPAIRNPDTMATPDASLASLVTHQESTAQSVMQDEALEMQVQVNKGPVTRTCIK
jgi:hypothetical protein